MKIKLPIRLHPLFAHLESRLRSVPNIQWVDGIASATAGEAFVVQHKLGIVPDQATGVPEVQADVWNEDSDRKRWSPTSVVLRCNVASTRVRVRVESVSLGG